MQMRQNNCKACHITANVPDDQVKQLLQRLVDSGKLKYVDEQTHLLRLETCKSCEYLELGNTCRQCGCLIYFRIADVKSTCPYPKKAKW